MMTNDCWNKLEIFGENSSLAVDHFSQMGYDAPPYYAILVDSDAIYFESRMFPPIKDLQEIAESYDVDLKLTYHLPGDGNREKFHYTCLKNRKLDGIAGDLKEQIIGSKTVHGLERASESINEKGHRCEISMNEWTILAYLAEKRYNEIAAEVQQPNEDQSTSKRKIGR